MVGHKVQDRAAIGCRSYAPATCVKDDLIGHCVQNELLRLRKARLAMHCYVHQEYKAYSQLAKHNQSSVALLVFK